MGSMRLGCPAIFTQTDRTRPGEVVDQVQIQTVTPTTVQAPAQTSAFCYTEAEEGRKGPDKDIDTEQLLGLLVGV